MPTQGNPRHTFRFEPDLWRSFLAAVKNDPHKRSAAEVVRDFVTWYVHQRGAIKPIRPGREPPAK
jgi:hypothetical protein